jgi:predicted Kef-type K+ transport protein
MLIAILAGIAAAAMLFALVTDLGVWYLIFGVGIGFSVYQTVKRRAGL